MGGGGHSRALQAERKPGGVGGGKHEAERGSKSVRDGGF